MTLKKMFSLATCCLLTLSFTSCLEEDNGLEGYFTYEGEFVPTEELLKGTGLPRVVQLEEITYSSKENGDEKFSLGHVNVDFSSCESEWCQAEVDDCGLSTNVDFAYKEVDAAKSITFNNLRDGAVFNRWAEDNLVFAYERDGVDIFLTCADCPGQTPSGKEYTSRMVKMRAIR